MPRYQETVTNQYMNIVMDIPDNRHDKIYVKGSIHVPEVCNVYAADPIDCSSIREYMNEQPWGNAHIAFTNNNSLRSRPLDGKIEGTLYYPAPYYHPDPNDPTLRPKRVLPSIFITLDKTDFVEVVKLRDYSNHLSSVVPVERWYDDPRGHRSEFLSRRGVPLGTDDLLTKVISSKLDGFPP